MEPCFQNTRQGLFSRTIIGRQTPSYSAGDLTTQLSSKDHVFHLWEEPEVLGLDESVMNPTPRRSAPRRAGGRRC